MNTNPESAPLTGDDTPDLSDSPNTVPDVATILEQIHVARRRMRLVVGLLVGTLAGALIVAFLHLHSFEVRFMLAWFSVMVAMCVAFFYYHKIAELQKQFAGLKDIQHIHYVIDALGPIQAMPDTALVNTAIEQLNKLQASDARFITPVNRVILNNYLDPDSKRLKPEDQGRLVHAILKALEQVGDETSIAPVRRLMGSPSGPIRNAVLECLPFLYQRASEQHIAQELLRPADNTTMADMLLRPATGTVDAAPEQLLRATTDKCESIF